MKLKPLVYAILLALYGLLIGCASIPQPAMDAILKDLQGCDRQYNLSTGGGAGLPTAQFSGSINCKAQPPTVAPQPPPPTVLQ